MEEKPIHVVQLGSSGFPVGMAAIERIRLLSLALIAAGVSVRVISRKGVINPESGPHFEPEGEYQGIAYNFATGSIYRPAGFLRRNLMKFLGWVREIRLLRQLKAHEQLDAVILSSMDLGSLVYYRLLTRWLKVPLIYQLVELNSAMSNRQDFLTRLSDQLLENRALKLPDAIWPISQLLTDFARQKAPLVPRMPIPVVCDFGPFEELEAEPAEPYFLYCGSSSYAEVVHLLIDAFASLSEAERKSHKLYLVIGGDIEGKVSIQDYIWQKKMNAHIELLSGLPYPELVRHYLGARALLIPLRPVLQDQARFPHKIGEYLASGRPIITNAVGEVPRYFTDQENAYLATEYSASAFASIMREVIKDPQKADDTGQKGKKMGLQHFDCYRYGERMKTFIDSLLTPSNSVTNVWH